MIFTDLDLAWQRPYFKDPHNLKPFTHDKIFARSKNKIIVYNFISDIFRVSNTSSAINNDNTICNFKDLQNIVRIVYWN